ncbi:MAG: ATP-binding cassette domain-containing protein [Acidobacteriota bacterium]
MTTAGASAEAPVAELRNVRFCYRGDGSSGWLLDGADLEHGPGEILAIVGPNGGGKTTLLKLLLGLVEPKSGQVRLFGEAPARTRHRAGYVPQASALDPSVPADALDIVLSGRLRRAPWGPRYRAADLDAARAALEAVGVGDLSRRAFGELSGGQRQRVLIARALVADAELLLLDEPTTGIDPLRERHLLELLAELAERRSVIMVTHDLDIAFQHATRVACVHHRRLLALPMDPPPTAREVIELFGVHLPHAGSVAGGPGDRGAGAP